METSLFFITLGSGGKLSCSWSKITMTWVIREDSIQTYDLDEIRTERETWKAKGEKGKWEDKWNHPLAWKWGDSLLIELFIGKTSHRQGWLVTRNKLLPVFTFWEFILMRSFHRWENQMSVQKPATIMEAAVSVFTLTQYDSSTRSIKSRRPQPNY